VCTAVAGTPYTRVCPVRGLGRRSRRPDGSDGCQTQGENERSGVLFREYEGAPRPGERRRSRFSFPARATVGVTGHAHSQVGAAVATSTTTPSGPGTGTRVHIPPCEGGGRHPWRRRRAQQRRRAPPSPEAADCQGLHHA